MNEVLEKLSVNHCHSKGLFTLPEIKITVCFRLSCSLPLVSSINGHNIKEIKKVHLSEYSISFPKDQGKGCRIENENGYRYKWI